MKWRMFLWDPSQNMATWLEFGLVFGAPKEQQKMAVIDGVLRDRPPGTVVGVLGVPTNEFERWFRNAQGVIFKF